MDQCNTFGDALIVLAKKRQAKFNEKFEELTGKIPLSVRNWRRITTGEVIPNLQTFHNLRRTLCEREDYDIFDAMYINATQNKERFAENDIVELIEFGSGVQCSRMDTADPKCFRAITFSPLAKIDNNASSEKAMAFFRSLRSLLSSHRLPALSDLDRQLRIAITLHREAWVARSINRIALHEGILRSIDALDLSGASAYIGATSIDHRFLATNHPDELFFPQFDKPVIDSHVAGFQESQRLFQTYDEQANDPLKKYGIESTADDAQINLLRLACMYGKDEAHTARRGLSEVKKRDEERGAPRFLTFYNDLVEIESLIALHKHNLACEMIEPLQQEATEMGRSDLIGEARMLLAKTHIMRASLNFSHS